MNLRTQASSNGTSRTNVHVFLIILFLSSEERKGGGGGYSCKLTIVISYK